MSDLPSPLPPVTVAIGIDVVETDRVARMLDRWGDRFLRRFFTPLEQSQLRGRPETSPPPPPASGVGRERCPERMAALIASKEATSKALGSGLRGVGWREMEVIHAPTGKPSLRLHGRAASRASALGWSSTSVSMTHDGGVTVAVVVALGLEPNSP